MSSVLRLLALSCALVLPLSAAARGQCEQQLIGPPSNPSGVVSEFGEFLSISGDTFVSSTDGDGVIVFDRVGGTWIQTDIVPSMSDGPVALEDDTLVVRATPLVEVFSRGPAGWTLQETFDIPGAWWTGDVAISGDTFAAGNIFDFTFNNGAGSVTVYERSGNTWTQTATIHATTPLYAGWFGTSIALEGDTLVVGAPGWNTWDVPGHVSVFERTGTVWNLVAEFVGENGFGQDVEIEGERVAIGSWHEGQAHILERQGGTWNMTATVDAVAGSWNGYAVALEGDVLVVGASTLHYYRLSNGQWSLFASVFDQTISLLGKALAVDNDTVIAGENTVGQAVSNVHVYTLNAGAAQTYCVAGTNSSGPGANMGVEGTVCVAANDLVLRTTACPPGVNGLYFYGPAQLQAPFGDGFRCVGAGGAEIFRLWPIVTADAAGVMRRPVDFSVPPASSASGLLAPFTTWNFQLWYRDPSGPLGSGFNLSDGLSLTFQP